MNEEKLSTAPYKGVRDFYPEDLAILSYIIKTWSKTAESFGFARYDASVLEPAELYKNKGAVNAEIVNEQTYTFIDRGERAVTLRPEMTPTAARLVAARARDLCFPLRWYAIPNLFRYERPQRGRLREHWQLNCDLFGVTDRLADIEILLLAHQILIDFGATSEMFTILVNDRAEMTAAYQALGITDANTINDITRLTDRKRKITDATYRQELTTILKGNNVLAEQVLNLLETPNVTHPLLNDLKELGVTNVKIDRTIARGFDYYTGMIFEVVDNHPENNRSLMGGGRYNSLTAMFSSEAVAAVGFGMGDVTMRDFLISHQLLPKNVTITAPTLMIIPAEPVNSLPSEKLALLFRARGIKTGVDFGTKKLGKKIADAATSGVKYAIVVGESELAAGQFVLKNLDLNLTETGSIESLITFLIEQT